MTLLSEKYYMQAVETVSGGYANTDLISTEYSQLDKLMVGGMRKGCCYLFSGTEKAGKSTFLFNVLAQKIMDEKAVGILSTEMDFAQVCDKLTKIVGVGDEASEKLYWLKTLEKNLSFYGVEELSVRGKFEFNLFLRAIDELENKGVEFVVIDNLTSLGAEASDYTKLGSYTSQLFTKIKGKNMSLVFVIHVKPTVVFNEKPEGIRSLVVQGKAEKIFQESITIIGKPTLRDVYGGGQALSQISGGAIFLWRPFQKFSDQKLQRLCSLIVDTHRFGPSGEIPMEYHGESGKFYQLDTEK